MFRSTPTVRALAGAVALLSTAVAGGAAGHARADAGAARSRIAILGFLASPDEASFARDLAGTVRWAARKDRRWDVVRADLPAAMASQGCREPDEACLHRIARDLRVDGIVFGRVAKNRGRSWSVGLYYFDRRQVRVTRSTVDAIALAVADVDQLRPRAKAYVDALAAGP